MTQAGGAAKSIGMFVSAEQFDLERVVAENPSMVDKILSSLASGTVLLTEEQEKWLRELDSQSRTQ